jgi:hypothetical protein
MFITEQPPLLHATILLATACCTQGTLFHQRPVNDILMRMKRNPWTKFKRVADAIRSIEPTGTSVKWNSRLSGQRFDAVLRSVYEGQEFLIVVDCIDRSVAIPAPVVKGFAKKVDRSGAQMGVMICSSDYELEAFKLSAEHSVALMDWNTVNSISEEQLAATFKPARLVYNFRFVPKHYGPHLAIPEEPPLLRYLMRAIRIVGPGIDTCPEELVDRHYEQAMQDAAGRPKDYVVSLPPNTIDSSQSTVEGKNKGICFHLSNNPRSRGARYGGGF